MTDFTVEAAPAGRITVRWTDGEADYWFSASVEGDKLGDIKGNSFRHSPTIVRQRHGEGIRRGLSYHSTSEEPFPALIASFSEIIERDGLATKALTAAATDRAERERQRIVAKAAAVRELRVKHCLNWPVHAEEDGVLAAFYDDVQNLTH